MLHFIQKNAVWCALSAVGIVGLVFLEQNVNYESSRTLLAEELVPIFKEFVVNLMILFQQTGAHSHTVINVPAIFINTHFKNRDISTRCPD
jgi:hypothetical protein